QLGSSFHGALCELFAERMEPDSAFATRIEEWSEARAHPDALALRAIGGLHALVRRGDALAAYYPPHALDHDALWQAVLQTIAREDTFLTRFLDSPPQTNEVGRSGILLGAALRLQERGPLAWLELGASAGLNLSFLEYRYQVGFGDPSAQVEIPTVWEGNAPAIAPLSVSERAGCDVNPLDPRADRERLLAYVWPDQYARITRTEAALAVAAEAPWQVERAPASQWLARKLAEPRDALPVVVHTIVWQYLPKEERAAITATLERHTCVRISVEGDGDPEGAAVTITRYPSGERTLIGRADYHGRWVRWS
ncbi:MAG TPA: DUF2332 family protein, partial [Polyangiales bacterium]|nr:DUF2332 family protein [Polyangiales bacterium]